MDKTDYIVKKLDELATIAKSNSKTLNSHDKKLNSHGKKLNSHDKKLDELADVVLFIKDRMATKEDLKTLESRLGGIENRLDDELDKRTALDVRVSKLERAR